MRRQLTTLGKRLPACALIMLCLSACAQETLSTDENNANNTDVNNSATNNANNAANNNTATNNTNTFQDCPVEARPIYVVDASLVGGRADFKLLRFDPEQTRFEQVGRLDCPAANGATPFSMSVDRRANAWVLYSSGEIFLVNTTTSACSRSNFQPGQNGFDVFGMGFVLRDKSSTIDDLYVAGGSEDGISQGTATLGKLNALELSLSPIASLSGWPELTGTANGQLWGFFPGTTPPKVALISREDGSESNVFPIDSITGDPNAWAFAFWGGDFYLFYKSQDDDSSRVFKLTPKDGKVEEILTNTGLYIVGAGVSTCAPTTL